MSITCLAIALLANGVSSAVFLTVWSGHERQKTEQPMNTLSHIWENLVKLPNNFDPNLWQTIVW